MGIKSYTKHVSTKATPQVEPVPGKNQVKNSAQGFVFEVSDWVKLERFLILGTEGGSYYASERELTKASAASVLRCIKADGPKTVRVIEQMSTEGRAPKNDPAIFALGLCLKMGDLETKRLAAAAVSNVCRIGTHIFSLAESVKGLGGWGRLTKKAFTGWYAGQAPEQLGMNLAKYQSRNGWSHRDILRKIKPKPTNEAQLQMYRWAVGKMGKSAGNNLLDKGNIALAEKYLPKVIQGFELAKKATKDTEVVRLIEEYGLPRECVPTEFLNSTKVWAALLMSGKGMPMTAMVKNLGKMSEIGLVKPLSSASKYVVGCLEDTLAIKRARIHPIALLMAQSVYRAGRGLKGSLTWSVDTNVADALDVAFYRSFANVEPTGKRFLLALDVSGSMSSGAIAGTHLTPREGSAAMALLTAKTEQWHHIVGFTSQGYGGARASLTELKITPKQTLPQAIKVVSDLPFGGTDCSLPMKYAMERKLDVDCFMVYTDSETYAGAMHPFQALQQYRQQSGIPAKLVVVGMVANDFSIADPSDIGMLDVVGFDANVPSIVADFVKQ